MLNNQREIEDSQHPESGSIWISCVFHTIPPGGSCRATSSRALQLRWPVFIMPSWAQRCETLGGLTGKFVGQFLMGTNLGLISWLFFKQIPTESFKKKKTYPNLYQLNDWDGVAVTIWCCCLRWTNRSVNNWMWIRDWSTASLTWRSPFTLMLEQLFIFYPLPSASSWYAPSILSYTRSKPKCWPRILHQHTEPKTVT